MGPARKKRRACSNVTRWSAALYGPRERAQGRRNSRGGGRDLPPAEQSDHADRFARHHRHRVAHDLQSVEAIRVTGQGFAQTSAECLPEYRADVEFSDARAREPDDIVIEKAGRAMDHERHPDGGLDLRKAREIDGCAGPL